ncbi:SDR family oxidoreductase [Sphingoaurantiacus capsulatus]|uniref:SDR family oxidoreductase n=1 Tax=Sphingoaurantiacus capsulatus TaxID=1771310 RepID=A0ABV7X5Y3_9SPHN
MDLGIRGRKAIVAGGSAGLGAASAQALAAEGVELFISARGRERLEDFAAQVAQETGAKVTAVVADHGTEAGRATLLAACPEPDILVITCSPPAMTEDYLEITPQDYRDSVETTLIGPIELMRATLEGMAERGFGRVVNIATIGAKAPWQARLLSGPTRSALLNFVHAVSKRYIARNVTMNNLLPGMFHTATSLERFTQMAAEKGTTYEQEEFAFAKKRLRIPAGRFGQPEELAPFCAMLCGAQASFITGQSLVIDGGGITSLL